MLTELPPALLDQPTPAITGESAVSSVPRKRKQKPVAERNLSHNFLRLLFPLAANLLKRPPGTVAFMAREAAALIGAAQAPSGDVDGPPFRVALVIGHNVARQGAICQGALPCTEFLLNSAVAQGIAYHAWRGLAVETFFRKAGVPYADEIEDVYQRVNAWQPDLTIEMHFNSFDGQAAYSLGLYNPGCQKSRIAAEVLGESWQACLQTPTYAAGEFARGNAPGALSGRYCKSPFVLAEPFFGDHLPTMNLINEGHGYQLIVNAYLDGLRKYAASLYR